MTNRRAFLRAATALALAGPLTIRRMRPANAANTDKLKKLVFIHGRGQGKFDPVVLKGQWLAAFKQGAANAQLPLPAGLDTAFPYYGKQLEDYEHNVKLPLTTQARGEENDDYLAFQTEFLEEVRTGANISDAQVQAEYGPKEKPQGVLNWPWVQAILRALDKHGGGLNAKTLEIFTRDVYLYTTRADVHDAINHTVAAALTTDPTVVVAHSLGTVVAYSILCNDLRALQVPTFVTLGCPLGVRAIRERYRPLHFPAPVKAWFNAFDTRDVVALYPLDSNNFPIKPPVENDNAVNNTTSNRHGIEGYLHDATVATRILQGL